MQLTVAQHISRLKTPFKQVNSDSRLTDKFMFLLLVKHRELLLKKTGKGVLNIEDLFQTKTYEELIDVDAVEACGIQTNCKIKRTKYKLENILSNKTGIIIRDVTSLDGYTSLTKTTQESWVKKQRKTTFKYDKTLYYWFSNGYLYFPNLEWDAVKITAYYDVEISNDCDDQDCCQNIQDTLFRIPGFLLSELDQLVYMDLQPYIKLPTDIIINKNDML